MHTDREGTVRLTRREFVDLIEIDKDGVVGSYKINPGAVGAFPWLSGLAPEWQQYQFLGLAMEYVPTSGSAIGSETVGPALGQVATCFKYNVVEGSNAWPLTDIKGMMNMQGAVSTSPACPSTTFMECDPAMSNQPVRWIENEQTQPGQQSQQNYLAAYFLIRAEGSLATTNFQCGQLWVTYEVLLFNPRPIDPSPTILTPWYERGEFKDYTSLVLDLARLEAAVGPYTVDEYIALISIIGDLKARLSTSKAIMAADLARALHARSRADLDGTNRLDPCVRRIIRDSQVYAAITDMENACPDDGDLVSIRSGHY
jgi:hypothetical protein